MTGNFPGWLLVKRVTMVSVSVCLVIVSLKRPKSVGGGGNWSSLNRESDESSFNLLTEATGGGGGGGEGFLGRLWWDDLKLLLIGC
jgi:hypothetical protein